MAQMNNKPAVIALVDTDRPCAKCTYNLKGIARSANCPECGVPVANSFMGDRLQDFPRTALTKIHLGAVLLIIGFGFSPLRNLVSEVFYHSGSGLSIPRFLGPVNMYLTAATTVAGCWLYTTRGVGRIANTPIAGPQIARILLRATSLTVLLFFMWRSLMNNAALFGDPVSGWINRTAEYRPIISLSQRITLTVLTLLYTRWLCRRIPNRRLARCALLCAWLFPPLILLEGLFVRILGMERDYWYLYIPDWIGGLTVPFIICLILNAMRRRLSIAIAQSGGRLGPVEV